MMVLFAYGYLYASDKSGSFPKGNLEISVKDGFDLITKQWFCMGQEFELIKAEVAKWLVNCDKARTLGNDGGALHVRCNHLHAAVSSRDLLHSDAECIWFYQHPNGGVDECVWHHVHADVLSRRLAGGQVFASPVDDNRITANRVDRPVFLHLPVLFCVPVDPWVLGGHDIAGILECDDKIDPKLGTA